MPRLRPRLSPCDFTRWARPLCLNLFSPFGGALALPSMATGLFMLVLATTPAAVPDLGFSPNASSGATSGNSALNGPNPTPGQNPNFATVLSSARSGPSGQNTAGSSQRSQSNGFRSPGQHGPVASPIVGKAYRPANAAPAQPIAASQATASSGTPLSLAGMQVPLVQQDFQTAAAQISSLDASAERTTASSDVSSPATYAAAANGESDSSKNGTTPKGNPSAATTPELTDSIAAIVAQDYPPAGPPTGPAGTSPLPATDAPAQSAHAATAPLQHERPSPTAEASEIASLNMISKLTGNSPAANIDPKQAQAENKERIIQQLSSRLQSALSEPAESTAITGINAVSTDTGGKSGNQSANQETNQSASPSPGPVQPKQAAASSNAASSSRSDDSIVSDGKSSTADLAAVIKAASFVAPAAGQQPISVPAEVAPQSSAAAAGGSSAPLHTSADSPAFARPLPLPEPLPDSLGDVVKASELYQRVGGAEMHISMDTDLLGSIDLRAVLHQSTLTATIGVQRADVQSLLANELPSLQHALSEQALHVEHLSVLDSSFGTRMDLSSQQQQHQQNAAPAPRSVLPWTPSESCARVVDEPQPVALEGFASGAGRLSIRV